MNKNKKKSCFHGVYIPVEKNKNKLLTNKIFDVVVNAGNKRVM